MIRAPNLCHFLALGQLPTKFSRGLVPYGGGRDLRSVSRSEKDERKFVGAATPSLHAVPQYIRVRVGGIACLLSSTKKSPFPWVSAISTAVYILDACRHVQVRCGGRRWKSRCKEGGSPARMVHPHPVARYCWCANRHIYGLTLSLSLSPFTVPSVRRALDGVFAGVRGSVRRCFQSPTAKPAAACLPTLYKVCSARVLF